MIDQFTCPYCEKPIKDANSLCDECWSEYLGTHAGGRSEKTCFCNICLSLGMRFKALREEKEVSETSLI